MKNKKRLLLFISLATLLVVSGCGKTVPLDAAKVLSDTATYKDGAKIGISIDHSTWCAEVVRSSEAEKTGLSGREGLTKGTGMVFLFDTASYTSFWMKDMKFDLDILWIQDHQVVDVSRNVVHPQGVVDDASLPRYTPKTPANFVLEVGAGEAQEIRVGDYVNYNASCDETPSS